MQLQVQLWFAATEHSAALLCNVKRRRLAADRRRWGSAYQFQSPRVKKSKYSAENMCMCCCMWGGADGECSVGAGKEPIRVLGSEVVVGRMKKGARKGTAD